MSDNRPAKMAHENERGMNRERDNEDHSDLLNKIFQGEVASVHNYGAFVKILGSRNQGLIHRTQISNSPVEDAADVLQKGERVWCKVIAITEDNKISLAMKLVDQGNGRDLDPNGVQMAQDEQRRKNYDPRSKRRAIELEAVLNTVCSKCGTRGHLKKDCFQSPSGKTYDLIPEEDIEDLPPVRLLPIQPVIAPKEKMKKEKKEKKKHKKEKSKKSTKHKKAKKKKRQQSSSESSSSEDSEDDSEDERSRSKHRSSKGTKKRSHSASPARRDDTRPVHKLSRDDDSRHKSSKRDSSQSSRYEDSKSMHSSARDEDNRPDRKTSRHRDVSPVHKSSRHEDSKSSHKSSRH